MSTLAKTWSADWEKRLYAKLRERGHERLGDYLAAHPVESYSKLADELGDDVAPIQLTRLQLSEARDAGDDAFRKASKDVLVRVLRQDLPDGWGRVPAGEDLDADYLNASAFASWGAPMKWAELSDTTIAAVGERLKALAPYGWLPTSGADDTIRRVFDEAWPVPERV